MHINDLKVSVAWEKLRFAYRFNHSRMRKLDNKVQSTQYISFIKETMSPVLSWFAVLLLFERYTINEIPRHVQ